MRIELEVISELFPKQFVWRLFQSTVTMSREAVSTQISRESSRPASLFIRTQLISMPFSIRCFCFFTVVEPVDGLGANWSKLMSSPTRNGVKGKLRIV